MVTIEDIENWIRENGDTAGFVSTEALVNHFVNMSKVELIEKACDWFRTLDDKEPPYKTTEEFIEGFKKAMMEE